MVFMELELHQSILRWVRTLRVQLYSGFEALMAFYQLP